MQLGVGGSGAGGVLGINALCKRLVGKLGLHERGRLQKSPPSYNILKYELFGHETFTRCLLR
jgi:hypothetical protein